MNISSLTNSITSASASAVGGLQPTQVTNGDDSDASSSGSGQVHHHHGGGHMRAAIASALQSLGLTMPTTSASAGASSSGSASSSSSSSTSDGSTSAASGSVQQDLQQFMHQLFEAVKSDSGSTTSAVGSTGTPVASNFASGLSTLIGQVGSGTAPAGLQSAFATLTAALQQTGGASSSSSTSTGSDSSSSAQATLQSFLTTLQQNMGYGAATTSPIGSLLTTQV